jgi:hypothetical protein
MRDFERLEELSSTVRSGLAASNVIWAIDQALAGAELHPGGIAALESGRDILQALASPGSSSSQWEPGQRGTQNMLGGDSVPKMRNMALAAGLPEDEKKASEVFENLAEALEAVCRREPAANHSQELEQAMEVFAAISKIRLGQASGIARSNRNRMPWLPKRTISTSS